MHLAIVYGKTLSISNAQSGFVIKLTKIVNFKISIKVYQLNQFRCVVEFFSNAGRKVKSNSLNWFCIDA